MLPVIPRGLPRGTFMNRNPMYIFLYDSTAYNLEVTNCDLKIVTIR